MIGGINVTILPFKNFSFDLQGKYVGKQYLDNTSNDARKLDPFYTQDARIAYTFGRNWLKKIDLVFQVNNLFNEMYEPNGYTFSYYYNNQLTTENFYFPMAGRSWVVGVNVRL